MPATHLELTAATRRIHDQGNPAAIASLGLLLSLLAAAGSLPAADPPLGKAAFVFNGAEYFHRWSGGNQHEFTPAKHEDLEKWSDMITVNAYPSVQDSEALVLENYTKHQARVLRTNSIPRTAERPAEHLIAVIFGQPKFIEVAFACLKLVDGTGYSFVYSHRIYGEKIGDRMSAWLKANGAEMEKALMEWNSTPAPASRHGTAL